MAELKTYGDLKKAIKTISLKQKGEKIGNVAVDTIIGMIPGIGNAKTTYDFIKAAFSKPDSKKTNSWLDKLDIDDNMSKIVDDTVENGFLNFIAKTLEQESDTKPLESDFNINQKLIDYLAKNYAGRTIAGVKTENKHMKNEINKFQLRNLINEEIKNIIEAELKAAKGSEEKKLETDIDRALKSITSTALRAKVRSLIEDPAAMKPLKNTAQRAAFLIALATAAGIDSKEFGTASMLVKKRLK